MAAGKIEKSPFEKYLDEARARLDEWLVSKGTAPGRCRGDRPSEIHFRRLAAMLEVSEDEDYEYLQDIAERGAILGVGEELPRVPKVFEEKTKWTVESTEEDFRDTFSDNYASAKENAADIHRQVRSGRGEHLENEPRGGQAALWG